MLREIAQKPPRRVLISSLNEKKHTRTQTSYICAFNINTNVVFVRAQINETYFIHEVASN